MWCPIHPSSEDLDEGRDVADAFTGTLFQSRIDDGKKGCRYVPLKQLLHSNHLHKIEKWQCHTFLHFLHFHKQCFTRWRCPHLDIVDISYITYLPVSLVSSTSAPISSFLFGHISSKFTTADFDPCALSSEVLE